MSKPSPSLESSAVPIPEPRPLKRAASTASSVASLPTPPRTARRTRRSSNHNTRSKGRAAARPRHHRTQSHSSSHDEDSTDVSEHDDSQDTQLCKRQKMESVPERPEDEDVFWLGTSGVDGATQHTATEKSPPTTTSTRYRSETEQKSVRSPVSPPPSKRQVQAPVTPSRSAQRTLITPRRSGRLSSRNRTIDSDVEDSAAGPLRDSPDNPFLASDKAPTSPDTPTPTQQGEKPTILYVLCVFSLSVTAAFLMFVVLRLVVASGVPLRTHTTTPVETKRTHAPYSQSNIRISHRARFASRLFSSKPSERSGPQSPRRRSIRSPHCLLEAVTSGRERKGVRCRQISVMTRVNRRVSYPSLSSCSPMQRTR
jgi:hypothetical protein